MQYSKYGYLFQIYNKIPTVDCNIFTVHCTKIWKCRYFLLWNSSGYRNKDNYGLVWVHTHCIHSLVINSLIQTLFLLVKQPDSHQYALFHDESLFFFFSLGRLSKKELYKFIYIYIIMCWPLIRWNKPLPKTMVHE